MPNTELVTEALKGGGIYGAIISVLMAVIMGLIAYIRTLHKAANKTYSYRLAERDTLKDALNESKNAMLLQVEATNDRNQLMAEMNRVISASNSQSDTLNALLKLQFEYLKEDHARLNQIVGAMADSVRNLSTSSQTIQTGVQAMPILIKSLEEHIDKILPRRSR